MDLSIIIVSYNTKELTLECVKSIYNSRPDLSFEVIVVDNGSRDGSLEELKKLRTKKIKNLKIIENKDNLGFAKANNQGISRACRFAVKKAIGKYILLLNSDTRVKKGSLERLAEFADRTPDAGVVGPKLLNIDGSLQGSVFRLPTIFRTIRAYWLGEKGLLDKYVPKGNEPQEVEALVMAAFLITPKAIKRVGLLDEKYFMYFEDLDYCKRVGRSGLKVYYQPASEVIHLHGVSGKGLVAESDQWRRLIPSSIKYHGWLVHQIINFIIWTGGKLF